MENKVIYEEIINLVYDAIDSEVGEKREYSKATEQPEQAEQADEDGEDPDWYVKAINRQHKKYRDEERRRIEAEQRLQQLESIQMPQQNDRPDIPPPPDPFDENYDQKIAERDAAIQRAAQWTAEEQARQHQEYQQMLQAAQQRASQLRSSLQTYTGRAEKLGVKPEDLQVAGSAVATMGINDDVATYILQNDQGPLITTYLARHPAELVALNGMGPMQAAVHIETKLRGKAERAHGKTQAPPPPESLDGGGAPPARRGPKGATFE